MTHYRRATLIALLIVAVLPARAALADPPLPPAEVRARRFIHEERPLWQMALAFPNDALQLLSWPLKHALIWAERVDLPDRIADFVLYPVHHLGAKESSH
jgi:hypothetical protein